MAILQALLALLTKSAGKIINALFGWAVHALFGQTSSKQQTLLSGLVAAAVAWPLLVVGIVAPKMAALVLAFVPIPNWVPSWIVRLVWLALALIVPLALGLAITAKAPAESTPEPTIKRLLRGFPITIGLAAAFLIMFVSVPIMRVVTMVRGWTSADVPLVTDAEAYHRTATQTVDVLNKHGFRLRAASPGWWVTAPTRLLGWFGGDAFRRYVPARLEYFESSDLTVSFYTSGALLQGLRQKVTWGHGLIAETLARGSGFLTIDPAAQKLESQIRRVWKVYEEEPVAHQNAPRLIERVGDIAKELTELDVPYDEWSVIYRQVLQLDRAVRGQRQMLDSLNPQEEVAVTSETGGRQREDIRERAREKISGPGPSVGKSAADLSTGELIGEITGQVGLLARMQIDLAKTELQADLRAEVAMASRLGIAALSGFVTVNLLLVTAVLALAQRMPAWSAGLAVSSTTLTIAAVAGLMGWSKRVRTPLERTRRTLKEDAQWTKERLA